MVECSRRVWIKGLCRGSATEVGVRNLSKTGKNSAQCKQVGSKTTGGVVKGSEGEMIKKCSRHLKSTSALSSFIFFE
ncbi:hypothetical protein CEXT_777751 [Caerostris extrusa]|uniref:Uncharacterized protein n=1 Tax=Caerostris extrusa TaxID=172846 RepID=A0AAV4W566_CAEEX|nr:hypothetical protein CEXT_777751 [Caerostris extrusa]